MQYKRDRLHFDGVSNQTDMLEDFIGRFREMLPSETQDRVPFHILHQFSLSDKN